jgi:hypothetical protein
MRILFRGTSALVLVMLVASCTKLFGPKGEDAGAEAGVDAAAVVEDAAPAPAPPAALATNEGDVARFPDETKLADVSAVTQRAYNVREAPPAGPLVGSGVAKGTTVTQIAQRGVYFLIVFDDPKAPGTKLMGWVHRDAFSTVIQDAGPLVCATGEVALFGDTPFCGKLCSADSDCPTDQACKGSGAKLLPNGKAGDNVTVCTLFARAHDAGAPDGGRTPNKLIRVDSGAPVVDSGALPPAPATADVVAPTGGACPAGFLLVTKTGKCHRAAPKGPTGRECKNPASFYIKCDKDEKKVCGETQAQCR